LFRSSGSLETAAAGGVVAGQEGMTIDFVIERPCTGNSSSWRATAAEVLLGRKGLAGSGLCHTIFRILKLLSTHSYLSGLLGGAITTHVLQESGFLIPK
jgi:hypothetical protein